MMNKTLWVVGGGAEAIPALRVALAMGLRVVVSDGNPECAAVKWGIKNAINDFFHFVEANTYNVGMTVDAVRHYHERGGYVHGVIALAADVPMTVSAVADAFRLPGLSYSVAELGADKWAMKQWLLRSGIPTARGFRVERSIDALKVKDSNPNDVWWVVKPMDSRGARGVTLLRNNATIEDVTRAFQTAEACSPTKRVLMEAFLQGPQFSTETVICTDGTMVTPGFLDRNYSRQEEFAPFIIEDGADAPTRLNAREKQAVIDMAENAALAVVGRTPCTVKADMVLTPAGPSVIELALRLSGGYMSSVLVPRNTGVNLVEAAIKLALGERVRKEDVTPIYDKPVAIRYDIPPGCTSHPERKSHAFGSGSSREEAIEAALKALDVGLEEYTLLAEARITGVEEPPQTFEDFRKWLTGAVDQLANEMNDQQGEYAIPDGDVLSLMRRVATLQGRAAFQVWETWAERHVIPVYDLLRVLEYRHWTDQERAVVQRRLRDLLGYVVLGLALIEKDA